MSEDRTIALLVSAGDGPAECNMAVGHVLDRMQQEAEAEAAGIDLSLHRVEGQHGPKSALVLVHGGAAGAFARSWVGTVQWRMQSQIRKHHKRANWFVGVFRLRQRAAAAGTLDPAEIAFSTLRAGGPGGQHQNTTDSAVRALHRPTGLSVVVRDGRSQHQNKKLAVARLQAMAEGQAEAAREAEAARQNRHHHALERGNPLRRFKGARFEEER